MYDGRASHILLMLSMQDGQHAEVLKSLKQFFFCKVQSFTQYKMTIASSDKLTTVLW